jgi:hypothetical protein
MNTNHGEGMNHGGTETPEKGQGKGRSEEGVLLQTEFRGGRRDEDQFIDY